MTHKTKATGGGRQWENTKHKPEHHSDLLAGGQCDQCAGLLVGYQPLGSIPRRFSSARPNSLSQLARLMPSLCASLSNCSFSSGEIRILNCGDCPSPLGLLSRLIVDKWSPIELAFLLLGGHLNTGTLKKAKPEGARNTNGLLTTNDNESIEVAMLNHTTHPQGRDSHNLNKYIWRFIALSTAQPRVIHIEATSEQEAHKKNQLIAIASQDYDLSAPAKSGAGIGVLEITRAHNTRLACFFVPHSHTLSMVGCTGAEKSAPGSLVSGYANPVQSTTSEIGVSCGGYYQSTREAAIMATIPALVHSQTAFIWRFIIFGASESQIIHVTAWTEREARNRCPSGCVAVFAARIRQEVRHD